MLLLKKKGIPRKVKAYRNFFGYRPQDRITPGEWFHEENLSSRSFPLLRPRALRRRINSLPIQGLGSLDGLCFLSGNTFHYKGRTVELPLNPGDKSLLPFGAYMIIRPDMVWVNTVDLSYGNCELSREFTDYVGILWCDREGNPLEELVDGPTAPENVDQLWLDTSLTPPVLKSHSHDLGQWYPVEHPCIRMNCSGIGELFPKGGRILFDKCPFFGDLMGFGLHELLERGRDFIVVEGAIATLRMETELLQFQIRAPAPYMDFLIAHENRLWGCRYGVDRDGAFVNEIYACALGDFTAWYRYEGIASDSYALSLGEPGPFTGAAVVGGYPVFFKEHSIHKVYGSTPSTFSLQAIPCVGIAPGSEKSSALLQNGLIYHGRDGFYLYDGSLPVRISGDLGQKVYRNAVSGTQGHLYYAACEAEDGSHPVLCYDSLRKLWHRESALRPKEFLESDGILYYRTDSPGLYAMGGKVGAPAEGLVYWEAVSGIFREEAMDKGVLVGLRLRMALEPGSALDLYGEFDSSGVWEPLGSLGGRRLSLQEIPFRIRPCDHFRLKLRGRGDGQIHSLILITEE